MTTAEEFARRSLPLAAARGPRSSIIALIAFLTLVDLFAAQAILPSLVKEFGVSRATMGSAVNASTFGMAIAGLGVALFGSRMDRRRGIWISLAVLAIPTAMLAFTDNIVVFALMRVAQGLCMATAFTLTMAYLAEHATMGEATGVLAAYVTGNVASNFFGRILSAALADTIGISGNFLIFAMLNLCGAALVWLTLKKTKPMPAAGAAAPAMRGWRGHLRNPELRSAFAIGFLILFVFIGTYTYVNFELVAPPLGLSPMALGLVYFIFLPSLLTTPFAGHVSRLLGVRAGVAATLGLAVGGLLLLLAPTLPPVLLGLTLVAVGAFLAQAIATGHVGQAASTDKASASGIYLASYYSGGMMGSFVVGQIYDRLGWPASVATLVAALGLAMVLATALKRPRT